MDFDNKHLKKKKKRLVWVVKEGRGGLWKDVFVAK
jgi:hypothetical protein